MSKREKITFFIIAYWHDRRWRKFVGATVKIRDLAVNLSRLGHRVFLFLPRYGFKLRYSGLQTVEVPLLNLPVLRPLSFNLFLLVLLTLKARTVRPDVVYIRRLNSLLPTLWAKLFKKRLFFEINDDPYLKTHLKGSHWLSNFRILLLAKADEINLRITDKAFVISEPLIQKICSKLPDINPQKLLLLPSGANTELFQPRKIEVCRLNLNLDPNLKYIGFSGSLLHHQGIDTLIDAAPLVLKTLPMCRFVIIGEGPMRNVWEKRVAVAGLKLQFLFVGEIKYEDTPEWIGAMDICVAPFLREAGLRSPVKIFDYLACGKATVASTIPGTTDLFINSGAVAVVEPEDPAGLAEKVIDLLSNHGKRMEMEQNGPPFVREKYDRLALAQKISDAALQSPFCFKDSKFV